MTQPDPATPDPAARAAAEAAEEIVKELGPMFAIFGGVSVRATAYEATKPIILKHFTAALADKDREIERQTVPCELCDREPPIDIAADGTPLSCPVCWPCYESTLAELKMSYYERGVIIGTLEAEAEAAECACSDEEAAHQDTLRQLAELQKKLDDAISDLEASEVVGKRNFDRLNEANKALADKDDVIERLKKVATKNRDGFEEYERMYYLELNKTEALQSELAELKMSYYERGVIIGTLEAALADKDREIERLKAEANRIDVVHRLSQSHWDTAQKAYESELAEARAEVERLKAIEEKYNRIEASATADGVVECLAYWKERAEQAQSEARQLRDALEPFAKAATFVADGLTSTPEAYVTPEDWRRAAAALTPKGTP